MTDLSINISVSHNDEPEWGAALELVSRQIQQNFSHNNELVEEFEEAVNYAKDLCECLLDMFHLLPRENHYLGIFDEETDDGKILVGIFELDSGFIETRRVAWLTFY